MLRPRTILYTALWALIGLGMVFTLFIRAEIDITVAPVRNPTLVMLSDGSIRNSYDVRLRNKNGEERPFHLSLTSEANLHIGLEGTAQLHVMVPADKKLLQRVYVTVPAGSGADARDRSGLRIWVEDPANNECAFTDTVVNGK